MREVRWVEVQGYFYNSMWTVGSGAARLHGELCFTARDSHPALFFRTHDRRLVQRAVHGHRAVLLWQFDSNRALYRQSEAADRPMEVRRDAARLEGGSGSPSAARRRGRRQMRRARCRFRRRPSVFRRSARQFCRRRARQCAPQRDAALEAAATADDGPAAAAPRAVRRGRRLPAERVRDARRAPRRRAAERRAAVERARLPLRRRAELLRPRASRRLRLAPSAGGGARVQRQGRSPVPHLAREPGHRRAAPRPRAPRRRPPAALHRLPPKGRPSHDDDAAAAAQRPLLAALPLTPAGARGGEAARTAAYRRPRLCLRAAGRRGAGGRTRLLSWARGLGGGAR